MEILDNPNETRANSEKSVEKVLQEGYRFPFSESISRTFDVFQSDFPRYLFFGLLFFISGFISDILEESSTWLESLYTVFVQGPLIAGVYIFTARTMRDEAKLSDYFGGFRSPYPHLILITFVQSVMAILLAMPLVLLGISTIFKFNASSTLDVPAWFMGILPDSGNLIYWLLASALFIAGIYMFVSWMLATQFVLHYGSGALEALTQSRKIVHRQWWWFFLYSLCLCIPCLVIGALILGVGLIATIPLMYVGLFMPYVLIIGLPPSEENES